MGDETVDARQRARAAFADVWCALPKVVFSRTLDSVQGNARLAKASVVEEVAAALGATDKDVSIAGADLAAAAFELGLVNELRIFRYPIVIGGGTPFLPPVTQDVPLDLIETRTFGSRVIYERYRRARNRRTDTTRRESSAPRRTGPCHAPGVEPSDAHADWSSGTTGASAGRTASTRWPARLRTRTSSTRGIGNARSGYRLRVSLLLSSVVMTTAALGGYHLDADAQGQATLAWTGFTRDAKVVRVADIRDGRPGQMTGLWRGGERVSTARSTPSTSPPPAPRWRACG